MCDIEHANCFVQKVKFFSCLISATEACAHWISYKTDLKVLQKLVESKPDRVHAVIKAKKGMNQIPRIVLNTVHIKVKLIYQTLF